jgi:hypothetical protein
MPENMSVLYGIGVPNLFDLDKDSDFRPILPGIHSDLELYVAAATR